MVSAMNVPMTPLRELARLGIGLFILDPFLPSLFKQYCFEIVTEDGVIVSPSGAG
jgi:hypothetical protein